MAKALTAADRDLIVELTSLIAYHGTEALTGRQVKSAMWGVWTLMRGEKSEDVLEKARVAVKSASRGIVA